MKNLSFNRFKFCLIIFLLIKTALALYENYEPESILKDDKSPITELYENVNSTYMKDVISDLKELVDSYAFSDILKNPPSPYKDIKVDISAKLDEIITDGKLTSLLELGAGFHPDFTGRENIYFNSSIFGLTRKEIDSRLNQIIEFSELGELIDNPVRTYSSGQYMRLAFSVAINVDAEILLIDEILSVGDQHFQKKCFDKMNELKKEGKIKYLGFAPIAGLSFSFGTISAIWS